MSPSLAPDVWQVTAPLARRSGPSSSGDGEPGGGFFAVRHLEPPDPFAPPGEVRLLVRGTTRRRPTVMAFGWRGRLVLSLLALVPAWMVQGALVPTGGPGTAFFVVFAPPIVFGTLALMRTIWRPTVEVRPGPAGEPRPQSMSRPRSVPGASFPWGQL